MEYSWDHDEKSQRDCVILCEVVVMKTPRDHHKNVSSLDNEKVS